MTKHILLMDGPDGPGLIYHVTGVLFRHGLNIIRNDEYVSPDGHFFMRTEFESGTGPDVPEPQFLLDELRQTLPDGVSLRLNPKQKKNVVVFVTKEHHCLGELLIRYGFDELGADILAVVSNYATLQPLVSKFGIPFHYISHEQKTREEHEAAILRTLAIYSARLPRAGKIYARAHPRFCGSLQQPDREHSPLVSACFCRCQPLPAGL